MAQAAQLLLRNPGLVRRIGTLFAELNRNVALQTSFIDSPADVVGAGALPRTSAAKRTSAVSRFIFAVLANEKLQRWFETYHSDPSKRDRCKEDKLHDLAGAFVEYGGLKLADDAAIALATDIVAISNISRTYIRTLNNRVTFITKIKVDDPPKITQRGVTSMQVVSMTEQLLDHANREQVPGETKRS